jgi:protein TonB
MSSTSPDQNPGSGARLVALPPRQPFAERRRLARRRARERVAARTSTGLTEAQRANDPLARGRVGRGGRALRALGAIVGSTGLHAAVVAVGFAVAGLQLGKRDQIRQQVDIQVREQVPPPPPPPPPEPEPEPEPEPVVKKVSRPPPAPEPEPPPPEPAAPPPRVVGLSLDSTSEGGGGPAFAVGNTREGKTAERAVEPSEVPREAPPEVAPAPNQTARRLPTAGVVYGQPKRKNPSAPPYPATLKAQGVEADVTVMVRLDAEGKVENVKVIKESPYPEFNEAARVHALAEEYEPATRDGVPIPYSLSFTYRFRLQEE